MTDEDWLDRRLSTADPGRSIEVAAADFDELLRQSMKARRLRRRTALIGFCVAGVIAIGASATPAAADVITHFLAQTGLFGDEASSEEDGSEWIDLLAPDAEQYIQTLYPSYIPSAPGVEAAAFKREVAHRIVEAAQKTSADNDGTGVRTQVTGLQRDYESYAYIDWVRAWIRADRAGDDVTRAQATKVMRAACSWPAFVATDGGGVIARMRTFATAAESGDVDGVQAAAEYNTGDDRSATGWDGTVRTWWFEQHKP